MTAQETSQHAALQNGWPRLRQERHWDGRVTFGMSIATAVATWCFIIGGFVSFYLTAVAGTLAILAGSLIGMLFIVLALLPVCAKYGIDSAVSSRPQLGVRGSVLSVVLIYGSTLGWNIVLFVFMGRATASIIEGFGYTAPGWITGASGIAGILVSLLVLRKGPESLRDFGPPIAVLTLVLGVAVMALLIYKLGVGELLDAPAVFPAESERVNWASGIEVLIASNLSWWAYTGGIVRNGPSARKSLWPLVIGLGLGVGVGSLAGFYAGLVIPSSGGDPTQFLVETGGPVIGVVLLVFVLIADLGTVVVGVYASAIALRQLPGVAKVSWNATTFLAVLPAFLFVGFFPDAVFDHFGTFLSFLGVAFGPMCGIQIADYFLLRRQRLDAHALYDRTPAGAYHYWGGVNPVGLVAFAAGVVAYLYLLDPVTYEAREPFSFLTASVPAVLVSGLVYWVGARLVLVPAGRGGYGAPHAVRAVPSQRHAVAEGTTVAGRTTAPETT
ncbi:purine-cytosine permease family protein [Geodermatophilus sp. SYSU D00705]